MPSAGRIGVTMLEIIGNMQQTNNVNSGTYFLLTFPVESLGERLSQILGAAGEGKPLTQPPPLLSQKQYPLIAYDDCSSRITYTRNQIVHTQIC